MQDDVDAEWRPENVLTDVPRRIRIVQRFGNTLLGERHLASDVQETTRETSRVTGNQTSLNELMRITLHQQTIFVGARLRLVTVDDEIARVHTLRGQPPLHASRESRTATTKKG